MNPYKVIYSGNWNISESKDCPFCGEKIKRVAIKCKHCLTMLSVKDNGSPVDHMKSDQETLNATAKFPQSYDDVKVGTSVATANNLQLIQMLFDGLLESLETVRGHIQRNNFDEKSKAIDSSSRIVIGLKGALVFEKGGELAENLYALYDYVICRMHHVDAHNDLTVLSEVYGLMNVIGDAWKGLSKHGQSENLNEINHQHLFNQKSDINKWIEPKMIMEAIRSTDSRAAAAAKLGLSPRELRYKIAELRNRGITLGSY